MFSKIKTFISGSSNSKEITLNAGEKEGDIVWDIINLTEDMVTFIISENAKHTASKTQYEQNNKMINYWA